MFISRVAATREIDIKATLWWGHKQFTTRMHKSFYLFHAISMSEHDYSSLALFHLVSNLINNGKWCICGFGRLGHRWFRLMTCRLLWAKRYLNPTCIIVACILGNKYQWSLNQNAVISMHKNWFLKCFLSDGSLFALASMFYTYQSGIYYWSLGQAINWSACTWLNE